MSLFGAQVVFFIPDGADRRLGSIHSTTADKETGKVAKASKYEKQVSLGKPLSQL